mgnify:CR=1 FL=1
MEAGTNRWHTITMMLAHGLKRFGAGRIPAALVRLPTRTLHVSASLLARRTALYDFHVNNGARIVEYGGFDMPLIYKSAGQGASHQHVRTKAGLFDVGHMVQHMFEGPGARAFLERLTPASLGSLAPFSSTLSLLLTPEGTIIDDLVVSKHSDTSFYVVTNAARRDVDLAWINKNLAEWNEKNDKVEHRVVDNGLVALQGPSAAGVLRTLLPADFDLDALTFGKSAFVPLKLPNGTSVETHVARGGYTGEDGFEVSIPPEHTTAVAEALLAHPDVELAGLAVRDSLRVEAGMCLYGNDIDDTVTPVEGGLTWTVAKDRREKGGFIGAERVLRDIAEGPPRRRVGIIVPEAPARAGAPVFAEDGTTRIGTVTSGIPSPTLGTNVAMALVQNGHHKRGTPIKVEARRALRNATIERMPFVPNKFYRGK